MLILLLACAGTTEPGDPCLPDPCADVAGTVCDDGRCVDAELSLDGEGGAFSGAWSPAEGAAVSFEASVADGVATAALYTAGSRIDVALSDTVTFTLDGLTLDGDGQLSPDEAQAVAALQAGDLAAGLAAVPLRLGCADADLDRQAVAALLAPWQLLLKYAVADRYAAAMAAATASGCAWLPELGGRPVNGLVKLDHESIVPVVYGHLPFDDVGELPVASTARAAGDLTGPCQARCRGACGADCQPVNCDQVEKEVCDLDFNGVQNGYSIAALEHICGTAAGCQLHDDCYDTCNGAHGCGTWDAAICRRGCDEEAIGIYGFESCQAWAMGLGPFEGTLKFTYPVDGGAARLNPATCPVPPGTLQWEDPPGAGRLLYIEAVAWCEDLVHDGHEDWRVPSMTEIMQLERGCPIEDCSAVDSCVGCSLRGGPAPDGCYWADGLSGPCADYWTSSPFVYQAGMNWIEMFFTGGAAIGHQEMPAHVRCVRVGP